MYKEQAVPERPRPNTLLDIIGEQRAADRELRERTAESQRAVPHLYETTSTILRDHLPQNGVHHPTAPINLLFALPILSEPIQITVSCAYYPQERPDRPSPDLVIDVADLDYTFTLSPHGALVQSKRRTPTFPSTSPLHASPFHQPSWSRPANPDDMRLLADIVHHLQADAELGEPNQQGSVAVRGKDEAVIARSR